MNPATEDRAYRRGLAVITGGIAVLASLQAVRAIQIGSPQLLKDATDWSFDVALYGIALLSFGRSARVERLAAAGVALVLLGAGASTLWDVWDKVATGRAPDTFVAGFSAISAVVVALIVVALMFRFRRAANPLVQATWLSSRNDVISTVGFSALGYATKVLTVRWPEWALDLFTVGLNLQAVGVIAMDLWRDRARLNAGEGGSNAAA